MWLIQIYGKSTEIHKVQTVGAALNKLKITYVGTVY